MNPRPWFAFAGVLALLAFSGPQADAAVKDWPEFVHKLAQYECGDASVDEVRLDPVLPPKDSAYFAFRCEDGRFARVLCGEGVTWQARGAECVFIEWLTDRPDD